MTSSDLMQEKPSDQASYADLLEPAGGGARRSTRGMALVAVLWITSLLALMAAGIGSSGRVTGKLAFNTLDSTKARFLAEAGVSKAAYELLKSDVDEAPWEGGFLELNFELDDELVTVQIHDEAGKIDLNESDPVLLEGLFLALGLDGQTASALADGIVGPVAGDGEVRSSAALGRDAAAVSLRPFGSLDELRAVDGMTEELFRLIRPHVTIHGERGAIDPFRASDLVLEALPGVTPEVVEVIRANADVSDIFSVLPKDLTAPFEDYLKPSTNSIFEIRSLGQTGDGARFLREVVLELNRGRGAHLFKTFSWRQGILEDIDRS